MAVLALVLVGELLALVLVLAVGQLPAFDWQRLAGLSFLIQWVVLTSAACLCALRPYLSRLTAAQAGMLSYVLVLLITLVYSLGGQWLLAGGEWLVIDGWQLLVNLLIAAIMAGIALRYFYLQQQLHNQQQAELQARIEALQARIQPHFLFNSMNSIACLIGAEPRAAEAMVEDLSALFRASLAEPALVAVDDELALARHYMDIEQQRLGARLQMQWQLGDYSAAARVPSLMLQPLLENAVLHGIQACPEGGRVLLSLQQSEGWLLWRVENPLADVNDQTGAGQAAAEQPLHRGHHLALENIRHRLQAHFGPEAQLQAEPRGREFVVTIRYPLEAEGK